jgi:hypothetical protein
VVGGETIKAGEVYGTVWLDKPDLIPIGGKWAYGVGLVQDKKTKTIRLRVVKGKVKGYTRRNEKGELEIHSENPLDPISQPNRLNIKSFEEWKILTPLVEKWARKLPEKTK